MDDVTAYDSGSTQRHVPGRQVRGQPGEGRVVFARWEHRVAGAQNGAAATSSAVTSMTTWRSARPAAGGASRRSTSTVSYPALAARYAASTPWSLPPTIASLTRGSPPEAQRVLQKRWRTGPGVAQPLERLSVGHDTRRAQVRRRDAAGRRRRCGDRRRCRAPLRHPGETAGGRHNRGHHVGAGGEPALEAADAVDVERRRDEPVARGEAQNRAIASSSAKGCPQAVPASGGPPAARTSSRAPVPSPRRACRDRTRPVGGGVADARQDAVLDEQAREARIAARRDARLERLPDAQPRVERRRVRPWYRA